VTFTKFLQYIIAEITPSILLLYGPLFFMVKKQSNFCESKNNSEGTANSTEAELNNLLKTMDQGLISRGQNWTLIKNHFMFLAELQKWTRDCYPLLILFFGLCNTSIRRFK
jgi:hypothetical protein